MIDHALASAMLDALRPPPIISPDQFAENNIRLSASMAARPGPLRLAPYQIEPLNQFASDDADVVVLEWAAQTGKSTVVNALLGYIIGCAPGPCMHVSPTRDRYVELIRERLDPIISSSPMLRALVGTGNGSRKGSAGGIDNTSMKGFPGGFIAFASSNSKEELAARAVKYLLLDETDRFPTALPGEGDPVALALKRTTTYADNGRRILIVSTPTTRMGSRIDAWFKRGDQRRWHVGCTDCTNEGPIDFTDIKWTPGNPDSAYHRCPDCGVVHDERQRRTMIERGRWVASATGEKGVSSYHLTELSSLFSTMSKVVQQFEAAVTPEERQTFFNTVLAQAYDAGTEVELSASELQQRAEPIVAPYNANIAFISVGTDVQSNRLESTYLAHHTDGTFSVLDHVVTRGDTSGDTPWRALDDELGRTFTLKDGRVLPVRIIGVDSGFNADQVLKFVSLQQRKGRSAVVLKGRGGFDRMPVAWGGKLKTQMRLIIVGVDTVKLALQRQLAMHEIGPGYIRLPEHLDATYFEGLASEELRVRTVRGALKYEYHRIVRMNESWDCLVYSHAVAKMVNLQPTVAPAKPGPSIKDLAARLHAAHNT